MHQYFASPPNWKRIWSASEDSLYKRLSSAALQPLSWLKSSVMVHKGWLGGHVGRQWNWKMRQNIQFAHPSRSAATVAVNIRCLKRKKSGSNVIRSRHESPVVKLISNFSSFSSEGQEQNELSCQGSKSIPKSSTLIGFAREWVNARGASSRILEKIRE